MIKLTVLGSGTCIPVPDRGNPGYLIETEGHSILLDCGAGVLRQLAGFGHDYRDIHHLCLSHLHPDHTIDLVPLLFALRNEYFVDSLHTVDIFAPAGFRQHLRQLREVYGHWIESDLIEVIVHEISAGGSFELPFLRMDLGPVEHAENSIAYRFEDPSGNVLVYSGDTGYSEAFAAFAKGADLLIIESAVPEGTEYDKHSSPTEAARMASRAGAKATILTHFYPQVEEAGNIKALARQHYQGELLLASDGLTYTLGQ